MKRFGYFLVVNKEGLPKKVLNMKIKEDDDRNQDGNNRSGKKKEERWRKLRRRKSEKRERYGQTWLLDGPHKSGKVRGRRRFLHNLLKKVLNFHVLILPCCITP
jgi:hypothetical protein